MEQIIERSSIGLGRAKDGVGMDFDEFVIDRLPSLVRYAIALTGSRELGEDLVQEAMIKAHSKWRRISQLDRPDLYVKRIVTNEFLGMRRRRALRTVGLEDRHLDHAQDDGPPSHEQTAAERNAMWAEMTRLPRQQRAVLVLRFYEGLTDLEIADLLRCRPGTVRAYASRALEALRIELTEGQRTDGPLVNGRGGAT